MKARERWRRKSVEQKEKSFCREKYKDMKRKRSFKFCREKIKM